jgi:type IV pilus assembly protein PilB
MRRTLEDLLLEERLVDEAGLRLARRHARKHGVSLARAVVEQGLSDEALAEAVARRLHLPRVDLTREPVDDEALREVPHDLADARRLLPLSIERSAERRVIRVAMIDPLDLDAVEEIEMSTGCTLEPLVARAGELADAFARHYRGKITQTIPRRAAFGQRGEVTLEPSTQPTHKLADEATVEVRLDALVALLIEKGIVDRPTLDEAIRRLLRGE